MAAETSASPPANLITMPMRHTRLTLYPHPAEADISPKKAAGEAFGTRIETFLIAACVTIGDIEGKPFSVAMIAAYMHVPRTTVKRRLEQLQSWGLIDRRGRHYHVRENKLNSLIGMKGYQQVRRILCEASKKLSVLDTLPN